jgi:hypothetical protein
LTTTEEGTYASKQEGDPQMAHVRVRSRALVLGALLGIGSLGVVTTVAFAKSDNGNGHGAAAGKQGNGKAGNGNGDSSGDPALECIATKERGAGKFCASVLDAWARFASDRNAGERDDTIGKAAAKLTKDWAKAEQQSAKGGVDCAAAFLSAGGAVSAIDSASGAIVVAVNDGLDPGDPADVACDGKLLRATARKCQALLRAESSFQKARDDGDANPSDTRDNATARAAQKFAKAFERATAPGCGTTATEEGLESQVDAIAARIARDTLSSPEAGDGASISITPGDTEYQGRTFHPVCLNGTPYRFFARRGTVNKLVMYYQGGGACWEQLTCSVPTCDVTVTDGDDPGRATTGFADLSNPDNPFRDWNVVFVSYCSCDIHFGDAAQDYTNFDPAHPKHVEHRGYQNAKVVEKWAREHFLAPEEVFVTGSSAGAYGAWFNAPLLHDVWPSAHFDVLADAGNGVTTQEFLEEFFPNWNFEANLPPDIPELRDVLDNGEGIPGYTKVVTRLFPDTNWAHYSTAFDGGSGGQTGFYNLMLHDNDVAHALTWWEGSCAFNSVMTSQAIATAAAVDAVSGNYRYYIGSGSRHTMYGSNKVYTDTTGGVPTIVDWVNAMLGSAPGVPSPAWVNVEADPFNVLLQGDPRPNPLVAPFEQSGSNVTVNCGP